MPGIGKPQIATKNPYQQVKMYQGPNRSKRGGETTGNVLNEISGKEEMLGKADGAKFVDGKKHAKLGKDGFLKLLTFQMQNQDPFKPMDQNKMAADMAQFSQLEQMTNMNKNLERTLSQDDMKAKFYAASFIGKKVITAGSTIKHKGVGSVSPISFKLDQSVKQGMVRVFDEKRQVIQQIDFNALNQGLHSLNWKGRQFDGTDAGKGNYTFEVLAFDEMNNRIPVETQASGIVQSVNFENGETVLTVDGKKVFLRDVKSFHVADNNEMSHNQNQVKQNAKSAYNQMQAMQE